MSRAKVIASVIGLIVLVSALAIILTKDSKDDLTPVESQTGPLLPGSKNMRIKDFVVTTRKPQTVNSLYKEIFIERRYFFKSDTKAPYIIDCGSHIGVSVLYFKSIYPQAELLAFEPDPENFELLTLNMTQNEIRNVQLENKALADREGTMDFYGGASLKSSLIQERGGKNKIEVPTVKLSRYIERPVDFLKLDVEGAEQMVLLDLSAENKLSLIDQMIIEYHHHTIKDVDELARFLGILETHHFGYQIESFSLLPFKPNRFQDIYIYAYNKNKAER